MRAEPGRIIAAAVTTGLIALLGTATTAQAEDFSPESQEWYGLAAFVEFTQNLGVDVRQVSQLDWAEVEVDDIIAIVYPHHSVDPDSLARFVSDGGRVVVADHYGASVPFLDRLSVERAEPEPTNLPHQQFVEDHPGWPLFEVRGEHPLITEVDKLIGNYPAVLHNVGGPVVSYDEQGGLIYDMMLGDGRAIVIADPSLFINSMLPVADHARLVANMWDYLCEEECRVWLLVREFDMDGDYRGKEDDEDGVVEAINDMLQRAFRQLPHSQLLHLLAIFVVFGTALYLLTVFRWRRPRLLSQYIDRHRKELSPPLTEFDWNVARFGDPDGRINYALPVALLKESFEELFLDALGVWPPSQGYLPTTEALARRFEERYLRGESPQVRKQRRQEVERLLRELSKVPTRHRIFLESDEYYRARDMERLHGRILQVLDWMGLKETYERQSGEINERGPRRRGR